MSLYRRLDAHRVRLRGGYAVGTSEGDNASLQESLLQAHPSGLIWCMSRLVSGDAETHSEDYLKKLSRQPLRDGYGRARISDIENHSKVKSIS